MDTYSGRPHIGLGLPARDDRGATAVEYSLMVALVALVIIGAVIVFGAKVNGLFELVISTYPFN